MKVFKKDDYVNIKGLEKPTITALESRFRADCWYECQLEVSRKGNLHYTTDASCNNKLTVEECLFAGSPEWAVDVCEEDGVFVWTNGGNVFRKFGSEELHIKRDPTRRVIYTRKKPERKTVADAVKHFNGEWPIWATTELFWCGFWNSDDEGYLVCKFSEFDDAVRDQNQDWFTREELPPVGTECEIRIRMNESFIGVFCGKYNSKIWVKDKEQIPHKDIVISADIVEFIPISPQK